MLNEQKIIDAINSHGGDILTISCVLAGLINQLRAGQGPEGVEAARLFALEVAKTMPSTGPTRPDTARISAVFNQHK
ncbi:hypothetical protein YA0783_25455 [Pseudomonas corrugata]|uniref:hypothetical protein n=1 Tax=Pseudomonas corrugata TaxID=47879 RepID=UPI0018E64FD8|nr:hypothetical protein [Pseudomonas corrugata]MBI6621639.1 hypothetical protein [Pseudomonas corrugata]MBI6695819.1 hypothetical protein [Pseudomonas corrugata]